MGKRERNKIATKTKIKQAFQQLLIQQSYNDLTMEKVATQAGFARITLYRYYSNKETLLMDCFGDVAEHIKSKLVFPQELPDNPTGTATYQNLLLVYHDALANLPLYKAFFCSSASATTRPRLRRLFAGYILWVMQSGGTLAKLPIAPDIVANLIAEMQLGTFIWWLQSGTSHPPELVAETAIRMLEQGLFGLIGQQAGPSDISFKEM